MVSNIQDETHRASIGMHQHILFERDIVRKKYSASTHKTSQIPLCKPLLLFSNTIISNNFRTNQINLSLTRFGQGRYETYLIPGETLIPGGRGSVSPWYWICLTRFGQGQIRNRVDQILYGVKTIYLGRSKKHPV